MLLFEVIEAEMTEAEKVVEAWEKARDRIQAAELTEDQRNRLLSEIGCRESIAAAVAEMLENVGAAAGKVYDVNGKAAVMHGSVEDGWNGKRAHYSNEAEGVRAHIDDRYTKHWITLYTVGNYQRSFEIILTETDGRKPRIDAGKTAEKMRDFIAGLMQEISNTAEFAERVKALEEQKRAILEAVQELSKAAAVAEYGIRQAFGFEAARIFEYGRF